MSYLAPMSETYRVRYEQDGDVWRAKVVGLRGCHVEARSLEMARARLRKALFERIDAEDAEITETIEGHGRSLRVAREALAARERAGDMQRSAHGLLTKAVRMLSKERLSMRDISAVLGISHQRVSQLLAEAP